MAYKLSKKAQSELIATILSILILTSSTFLVTNGTINSSAISNMQFNNTIEKTATIEVFANTIISLDENLNARLGLDNGTAIPNQEITFQLSDQNNSILKEKTDSEGYAKPDFDLYKTGPGNYSLSVEFQGSPSLYLKPSFLEASIEIIEDVNGTLAMHLIQIESQGSTLQNLNNSNFTVEANLTNQTLMNVTNETLNVTNLICKEFNESVLWLGKYSTKPQGFTEYYTWFPKHNCTELGETTCIIKDVEIKSRLLYPDKEKVSSEGEDYVQISEPDESICDNPEQGIYEKYLAYESVKDSKNKWDEYCGDNKNLAAKCSEKTGDLQSEFVSCFGVKTYASQYSIVDVVEIKYSLCQEND